MQAMQAGPGSGAVVKEKSLCLSYMLCPCQLHRIYLFGVGDWLGYCFTCGPLRNCCNCCECMRMRELTMAAGKVETAPPVPGSM